MIKPPDSVRGLFYNRLKNYRNIEMIKQPVELIDQNRIIIEPLSYIFVTIVTMNYKLFFILYILPYR
jgi:hypothetical protein